MCGGCNSPKRKSKPPVPLVVTIANRKVEVNTPADILGVVNSLSSLILPEKRYNIKIKDSQREYDAELRIVGENVYIDGVPIGKRSN